MGLIGASTKVGSLHEESKTESWAPQVEVWKTGGKAIERRKQSECFKIIWAADGARKQATEN